MIPSSRKIHAKLDISRSDGETWENVTDWLVDAEISLGSIEGLGARTGADIGVRTLNVTLKNEEGKSLAPKDKTSHWNKVAGVWDPLLWPYREASLQVGVENLETNEIRWLTLFEGYMGNNISAEAGWVKFECRDKSKRLQDAYIHELKEYEGTRTAEALIQQIINDHVPNPPTLWCPVSSGITFESMDVEDVSVWDAIQNIAGQTGWFLGYRWNGVKFVLAFLEPPRDKTAYDYELNWVDDIYKENLDINDVDIRNALVLSYWDKSSKKKETLSYEEFPQLRNESSKNEYGGFYRVMKIEEANTSLIDTTAKALSFGEKCIWDVSELSSTNRLDLPLLPGLDLFSTMLITNPQTSSDDEFYAVQSIRHTLRFGKGGSFRTEVIATGRVVGAKSKWLEMEVRPGRGPKDGKDGIPGDPGKDGEDGEINVPIPADPVWRDYSLTNALRLTWYKAEFSNGYEIRDNLNWGSASGMLFTGYDHDYSFIPQERELILYLRALNALGEYSDGYDVLNISLPVPEPPRQPVVDPYFTALQIHVIPLNSPAIMGYYVYLTKDGETESVKTLVRAGEHLTYSAPSGTTFTVQVSAFDILGEGPKSEPLQATTTYLNAIDIPEDAIGPSHLTESLRDEIDLIGILGDDVGALDAEIANLNGKINLKATASEVYTKTQTDAKVDAKVDTTTYNQKIAQIEVQAGGIQSTVGELQGDLDSAVTQVNHLKDEYTVKMQTTTGGKKVAAGFGMAKDATGNWEFGIMADKFRIFAVNSGGTITDEKAVFALDTTTGKSYLLGNLIADGTIQAHHLESESVKTMLVQAGVAYLDEANVLHLKADRISVGGSASKPSGIVVHKPEGSVLWHFDNSLQSTQGLSPVAGSATLIEGGMFGGGVQVNGSLAYQTVATGKYAVVVHRAMSKLSDYNGYTLQRISNL